MDITDNRHIRQSGLVDESILNTPITIVGAGAIGSFVALALAKCGFHSMTVLDPDTIEEHNISNQFYPLGNIGENKVTALRSMLRQFEDIDIVTHPDIYRGIEGGLKGIVISAVDNMATRKQLYEECRRNPNVKAYIDGRMGGNQLEVYTVEPKNAQSKKYYKSILWSDDEASETRCTEKAVIYNVLTIASWIVNQTRLVLSDKPYDYALVLDLETMTLVKPRLEE